MRHQIRKLRHRFGVAARSVAVRAAIPWYVRLLLVVALMALGFGVGYWRYSAEGTLQLRDQIRLLRDENQQLRTQSIHVESQKQVTQVAQKDLAKDMAALQEENVQLKEELAFYKNILADSSGVAVVKVHSFKISKLAKPGEYDFRVLLIQSGRHDRSVQGSLQIALNGTRDGKPLVVPVTPAGGAKGFKINFKYYQPVEGSFSVPDRAQMTELQAKFFQMGSSEPKLTQSAALPQ